MNAISTLEIGQVYGGVRGSTPLFDLAFGFRDTFSYQKPFLIPRASFHDEDVLSGSGPKARYWAWEAEAVASSRYRIRRFSWTTSPSRRSTSLRNRFIYDESYGPVIGKPFFQVLRVAAVARFLHESALKIGVLTEYLFSTGRSRACSGWAPPRLCSSPIIWRRCAR